VEVEGSGGGLPRLVQQSGRILFSERVLPRTQEVEPSGVWNTGSGLLVVRTLRCVFCGRFRFCGYVPVVKFSLDHRKMDTAPVSFVIVTFSNNLHASTL
jgi:hypothetical protein